MMAMGSAQGVAEGAPGSVDKPKTPNTCCRQGASSMFGHARATGASGSGSCAAASSAAAGGAAAEAAAARAVPQGERPIRSGSVAEGASVGDDAGAPQGDPPICSRRVAEAAAADEDAGAGHGGGAGGRFRFSGCWRPVASRCSWPPLREGAA